MVNQSWPAHFYKHGHNIIIRKTDHVTKYSLWLSLCVCVCVCVWEKERDGEHVLYRLWITGNSKEQD